MQGCYWIQKGVKKNIFDLLLGPVIPYGPPFLPSANVERRRARPTDRRGEVGVRVSAPLRRAAAPYGVAYGWKKTPQNASLPACLIEDEVDVSTKNDGI